jgi:hypothetical protein
VKNLVKKVLDAGGSLTPLIIPSELTKGTGTFNPSIYNDDGNLVVNIRHCQVTIFHSETNKYEHAWGPLVYLHPENDQTLTTTNYFCTVNDDLLLDNIKKVDFALDVKPLWEFIGLEDCRVVRWDGDLYLCGVRRDTTTNGQGRMELSKIEITDQGVKEISRHRMPAPNGDNSYCEKNWMPVLDMPFHFVKWTNPTEVAYFDIEKGTTETVFLGNQVPYHADFRGGSQVVPFGDYRVAICHHTYLYKSDAGRKNVTYRNAFVVWDKDWNVVKYCKEFTLLDSKIEFVSGMCHHKNHLIISFGIQDNAAFLLKMPLKVFEDMLNE